VLLGILERWVPATYRAFVDYRLGAVSLSRPAVEVVRRLLAGEDVGRESSGLSAREWRELMAVLGR